MMYHWSAIESKAKTMPDGEGYMALCKKLGTMHGQHIEIPGDGVAEIKRRYPEQRPAKRAPKQCNCGGL